MLNKKLSPVIRFYYLISDEITDSKKFRLGQVLTIIDAAIADKEQRKAIKDLIENAYWRRYEIDDIKEIFRQFFQKYAQELVPKDKDDLFIWNDKGIERSPSQNYFSDE